MTGQELADLGDRLITIGEVCAKTGLSVTTIYRRLKDDKFPDRVFVGERNIRWRLSAIEAWMASLRSKRTAQ